MTKDNLQPISELMTSALAPIHTHLNQNRAFWQRRCRAAAAGAVLKPQGGNCAVFPLIINERKNQPPAVQMHKAGGWFYKS